MNIKMVTNPLSQTQVEIKQDISEAKKELAYLGEHLIHHIWVI